MVTAYSVFANRGEYIEPISITQITDSRGKVIHDFTKEQKRYRILSSIHADMIRTMLQSVVDRGTAGRLRYKYGVEGDVAGKTGTTQAQADGWFIGFTPKLISGVWVGAEDRRIHFRSLNLGQGAATALPVWGIFMKKILSDKKYKKYHASKFPIPAEEVIASLACVDYIAPDTIDRWWWPFDNQEDDANQTEEKIERNEERKAETDGRAIDKIKDIFRRKRKR
jgi:penicillin-binding protein 1A